MQASPPVFLQFFPTLQCNRRCSFCFNRGVSEGEEIGIHEYERLVAVVAEIGIREVDLLGGEPTLYSPLERMVEITLERGLRLNLSTNGTDIPRLEETAGTYGNKPVTLGISLNRAPVPRKLHDYIVRTSPVLKSLYRKETGLPGFAYPYLEIPGQVYYLLYRDAVTRRDLAECTPFPVYYRELSALKERYPHLGGVYCSGFLPDIQTYPQLREARCPAGTTKLSVLPDGSAYPCYLLFRNPEFRLGNILEDDFRTLWEHPVLTFFREFRGNSCPRRECPLHSGCHGGCPAVSLLLCGDLAAPDPRCIPPSFL